MKDNSVEMNLVNKLVVYPVKGFNFFIPIISLLLILACLLMVSCKKECVDNCNDYAMILDVENCTCICAPGLTNFEINGYSYCIEESKTHDIYYLDNFNASSWVGEEHRNCIPPEIFISFVPKGLDTLNSFYSHWWEDPFSYIYFQYYSHYSNYYHCLSDGNRRSTWIPLHWLVNNFSTEIYIFGLERFLHRSLRGNLNKNLFNRPSSLGVIRLNENSNVMVLDYLGYNHMYDMSKAFYSFPPEEWFDFPFYPYDEDQDPYDPLHITLTFSRLNFE